MRKHVKCLSLMAGIVFLFPCLGHSMSRCDSNEESLFDCDLKKGSISVCLKEEGGRNYVRYIHEKSGKIDMIYPASPAEGKFFYSSEEYGSGYVKQIIFFSQNFQYVTYLANLSRRDPDAGILIRNRGKLVSRSYCRDPYMSKISKKSEVILEKTVFVDDWFPRGGY